MATARGKVDKQRILRITDIVQEPLEVLLPIDGYEEMPLVSLEEAVEKLVPLLPRVQTYAHVAKERCKEPADDLTQDESASIMLYTMGWEPIDKCLYVALNATLRSKDRGKLKPWFLYLRLLFNALFRLPSIPRTVFRGVKLDLGKQYANGTTIVWWGCSSCTVAISVLQSEDFLGETGVRTMFTIECLNGRDIRKHSYHSSEDEILLLPATHFKVIDSLNQRDLKIIHLQEIVPRFPLLQPVSSSVEHGLVLSLHNSSVTSERKAVDLSGRIGSYYDLHRDCLVELPCINFDFNEKPPRPQTDCRIEKGDRIESQNLLQFIGFDDELRLSLISNIVSPSGIASVIGYPYLIDECTRVLYYSYTIRQESLPTNLDKIGNCIEQSTPQIKATHIITAIDMGIDLIVILRLKSSDSKTIDDTLEKIRQFLISDAKLIDNVPLDEILFTRIYSNIHYLTEQKTLIDVCNAVGQIKTNFDVYQPSNYILHSIERFFPENKKICNIFVPLKPSIIQKIEQYLLRFLWINRMWLTTADSGKCDIFNVYLQEQLKEVKTQLSKLNEEYKNEKKRCEQFILKMRYENDSQKDIEYQSLNDHIQKTSKNNIDDFIYSVTSLEEKVYFINDLKTQDIDYENANKYKIEQNDNENTIQKKLIGDKKHRRILCSNDTLNNTNFSTLQNFCSILFDEKKSNPHLHLIYVDFTYSPYKLEKMKIFPLNNNTKDPNQRISFLSTKKEISHHLPSRNDKNINILLLGKSGVGKSTLINTFKSYLKYNCYEDFQSDKSALPIVVAFRHLFRMNSEDHLIPFGIVDRNEDFDHRNQSTTQQCKSYNFPMNNNEKICLIDTPGFGQDNDDIVMQHILSRITNLTHLNVICILIQSDDNQLDDYQVCLTKLFHFLGNQAINNIVFCFTKTISKDVNREQRNQSIQLMLDTLPTPNIPFNEKMTFDFDSTFFIDSTIARRFSSFIGSSNQTSERSWQISNNGWNRLLNHIRQNLHPLDIQQDVQKAQVARIEINQLIRPLLETVRNNIRNFLLVKTGSKNCSIELCPIPLPYPSAICYSCRRPYVQCGPFWIMSDSPHEYRGTCYTCSCSSDQHIQIEYRLECKYITNQMQQRSICQEDLLDIIVHFAQFLLQGNQKTNNDPFLSYLNQMINEERSFSSNIDPHGMNLALYNQLIKFRQHYQRRLTSTKQESIGNDLDINDLIEKVKQIPIVKIQLDASRKMEEIPD